MPTGNGADESNPHPFGGAGASILGDVKYGPLGEKQPPVRLALHAIELEFAHPLTGEMLRFESECPREMPLP